MQSMTMQTTRKQSRVNSSVEPETIPLEKRVPATMNAVTYERYGGPETLRMRDVPTPDFRPGSVLIEVRAAGINPIDYRIRRGDMRWLMPGGFPRIPGYDVAGEVVDTDASSGLRAGDRVLAFLDNWYGGGYAPYARCGLSAVAKIPDQLSYEQAAAMPLAGSTALQALRDKATIKPGDRVLINGASGGVGIFAVQIAKLLGAHVTAVASSKHEAFVRSLGADDFVDYHEQRLNKLHRSWHVVFDVAGKLDYFKSRHLVIPQGTFVTTEPDLKGIAQSTLSRLGMHPHCRVILARSNRADLESLVRYYASDKLKVIVDETLPLHRADQAHRKLEAGGHRGKIVLTV